MLNSDGEFAFRPLNEFSENEWNSQLIYFDSFIYHSYWYLKYVEILNKKYSIQNLTTSLYKGNDVVAIIPFFIEIIDGQCQCSIGEDVIPAPIFHRVLNKSQILGIYELIVNHYSLLIKQKKCNLARFGYSPLCINSHDDFFLKKFNYIEDITNPDWYIFKARKSVIIELNKSFNILLKNCRKGHRANYLATKKKVFLKILNSDYYDKKIFDDYVDFYLKIKGPKRTLDAFKFDYEAIAKGFQILFICYYREVIIGAIAVHCFQRKVRYNSSVQAYGVNKGLFPNHFLIIEAIKYFQRKDFELFELGEVFSKNIQNCDRTKEYNISHFKLGFGGEIYPSVKVQKKFTYDKSK